jgi:hypothetical protein
MNRRRRGLAVLLLGGLGCQSDHPFGPAPTSDSPTATGNSSTILRVDVAPDNFVLLVGDSVRVRATVVWSGPTVTASSVDWSATGAAGAVRFQPAPEVANGIWVYGLVPGAAILTANSFGYVGGATIQVKARP